MQIRVLEFAKTIHSFSYRTSYLRFCAKDVTCYWFNEIDADLQPSTFASLIVDFLTRKYLQNNTNKPIIVYSDGCTYQNRNSTLANALLNLSFGSHISIILQLLRNIWLRDIHRWKRTAFMLPQNQS